MRPTIAFLLLAASLIGGCDRQSEPQQQANAANVAAPAAGIALDRLDRSHKGEAAPGFAFEDPKGAKVTLANFRGRPVLLNLWATWCAPCVKEMPTLDALAVREGDRLHVIALSQDSDAAKATAHLQEAGFRKLERYLDTEMAFSMRMGVNLPTTILYDSQGREVWRMLGDTDWAGEAAAKLIAEAR